MKAVLALFALVAASTLGDWFYGLWHGPVHLTCQGESAYSSGGSRRDTLHVEIDYRKGTVNVKELLDHFTIAPTENPDIVRFEILEKKDYRGSTDRYTGRIG